MTARRTFLASLGAACVASGFDAPRGGRIDVAFVVSDGVNVIDFTGPWEVFQDTMVGDDMPFRLWTVAATRDPVRATGGLQIVPHHAVADAPQPRIVIVPAHRSTPATLDWLKAVAPKADVVASVCTGAFALVRAGLLDGLEATTHHDFHDEFARAFPKVRLMRDRRFVDSGRIATAAGLTSGIDLALHVVDRTFGRDDALRTATYMEHESTRWTTSRA